MATKSDTAPSSIQIPDAQVATMGGPVSPKLGKLVCEIPRDFVARIGELGILYRPLLDICGRTEGLR